jgi:hypothetical protein
MITDVSIACSFAFLEEEPPDYSLKKLILHLVQFLSVSYGY